MNIKDKETLKNIVEIQKENNLIMCNNQCVKSNYKIDYLITKEKTCIKNCIHDLLNGFEEILKNVDEYYAYKSN